METVWRRGDGAEAHLTAKAKGAAPSTGDAVLRTVYVWIATTSFWFRFLGRDCPETEDQCDDCEEDQTCEITSQTLALRCEHISYRYLHLRN